MTDQPGRTVSDGDLPLAPKASRPAAEPAPTPAAPTPPTPGYGAPGGGSSGGSDSPWPSSAPPQLEPMATASLVCGVLSIATICCCGLFTFLLAPLAILFGILSVRRIRAERDRYTGEAMAWAGIGTGAAALGFWLLYLAFMLIMQVFAALG